MPKVSQHGNSQILLSIKPDFIKKYRLEDLVNEVLNPMMKLDFTQFKEEITLPFILPNFRDYDIQFLTQFIQLFENELSEQILKSHADNLLCLACTYNQLNKEKNIDTFFDRRIRIYGKLLLNFIKAPLPNYTLETVYEAFKDEELEQDEIEDLLLMYLGVESKMPEVEFKDENGKLDHSKVDKELEYRLIKRVLIDRNISIEMPNGNYLIISNEISADFSYNELNANVYFAAEDIRQKNTIIKSIVTSLFDQQQKENPEFYQALLEHDFLSHNYDKLSKAVGRWDKSSQNDYILNKLQILIMEYLAKESLLVRSATSDTKRIRNNFIYKYFILLGLSTDSKGSLTHYNSISEITHCLNEFVVNKKNNANFAREKFHNRYRNTTR